MRAGITWALALSLVIVMSVSATAENLLLQRGTRELGLTGSFDFEREGDPFLNLTVRYGYFIRDYLEVGGVVELSGDFNDTFRYGLGGFAEYHLTQLIPQYASLIPYVGADLSLTFVDSDISEDNAALLIRPRVGLKWFIRDYFAIDANLFVAVATDDVFRNKSNGLDPYDVGLNLGLRVYFR